MLKPAAPRNRIYALLNSTKNIYQTYSSCQLLRPLRESSSSPANQRPWFFIAHYLQFAPLIRLYEFVWCQTSIGRRGDLWTDLLVVMVSLYSDLRSLILIGIWYSGIVDRVRMARQNGRPNSTTFHRGSISIVSGGLIYWEAPAGRSTQGPVSFVKEKYVMRKWI